MADAETVCAETCGARCCHGHAFLTQRDERRLRAAGHSDFAVAAGDARVLDTDEDGRCLFLGPDDRCTVYEDRPLDCRLFPFGVVLDEAAGEIRVVLVDCPLSREYDTAAIEQAADRAVEQLREYSLPELRAYDELAFSGEPTTVTTVPIEVLER